MRRNMRLISGVCDLAQLPARRVVEDPPESGRVSSGVTGVPVVGTGKFRLSHSPSIAKPSAHRRSKATFGVVRPATGTMPVSTLFRTTASLRPIVVHDHLDEIDVPERRILVLEAHRHSSCRRCCPDGA